MRALAPLALALALGLALALLALTLTLTSTSRALALDLDLELETEPRDLASESERRARTKRPTSTKAPTRSPTKAPTVNVQVVARGLGPVFPTAFNAKYAGHVFYATLGRSVKVLRPGQTHGDNATTVWQAPADYFTSAPGSGILGLTLDPATFASTGAVWLYLANRVTERGLRNQVWRVTVNRRTLVAVPGSLRLVWSSKIASGGGENGGPLVLGPDGFLYVGVGDGNDKTGPAFAQNASDIGKIHRITRVGGVPPSNPVRGSTVFARGIRNVFGLAFDPVPVPGQKPRLWSSEDGPQCGDELNLVFAGANNAWGPGWTCDNPPASTNPAGSPPTKNLPKWVWNSPAPGARPPSPTGIAFCDGCGLGDAFQGKLFVGFYNTAYLSAVTLNAARDAVESVEEAYANVVPIVAVGTDAVGVIHFTDAAGNLKRVVPKA